MKKAIIVVMCVLALVFVACDLEGLNIPGGNTGNSGNVDEIAKAFIAGTLAKSSKSTCQDHHDCHCH